VSVVTPTRLIPTLAITSACALGAAPGASAATSDVQAGYGYGGGGGYGYGYGDGGYMG
jgi:hypothetical protein